MPLGIAIQNLIASSDLNQADTIRECEKMGLKLDKSTLTKYLSGKIKKPNPRFLEVITKVCNGDIQKLLLEQDFDNSPQMIKEVFYNLKLQISNLVTNFIENQFDEQIEKEIKKVLRNEPIGDFLMHLLTLDNSSFNINDLFVRQDDKLINTTLNNIFKDIKISTGYTINDNGMFPIVPKGSKVIIEIKDKNDYKINDIFLIKLEKSDTLIARYIKFEKDKIVLYTINKNYKVEEYKENDVIILGKITSVTTNIE